MAFGADSTDQTAGAGAFGSLRLLTVPFVFTQDDLLDTGNFIGAAKARGIDLTLPDLRELHRLELLVPLYRIDDEPIAGLRFESGLVVGNTLEVAVGLAASEGRLRDPSTAAYSDQFPYETPDGKSAREWWNGYLYSSWQLLQLHHVVNHRDAVRASDGSWEFPTEWVRRFRSRAQALVALSPRFMPSVIGQLSMPPGMEMDAYWRFRHDSDLVQVLNAASFDPADLKPEAEDLLFVAHRRDPLAEWLPLIRHSSHAGWFKLKGEALACIWARIGAEILLRAHEELAETGLVEPLPNIEGINCWMPMHDRLSPHATEADSLERALGAFDLSPHPRVLILVEGETEFIHVPALLADLGLERPEQVRVQLCKGSTVNVQLVTRYGIAPRLGRQFEGIQLVDRTPTALLIAMDQENRWSTQAKRDTERRTLQEVIREEVALQGGRIGQEDLDFLVNIRVWGEDTYELANFTDDELVPAITQLARSQANTRAAALDWEPALRTELAAARSAHVDIKVPIGRMRMREDKTELARLLWPALLAKCQAELASDTVTTPVLDLVLEAQRLVAQLSGTGYALQKVDP